jgi:hypothetical protein
MAGSWSIGVVIPVPGVGDYAHERADIVFSGSVSVRAGEMIGAGQGFSYDLSAQTPMTSAISGDVTLDGQITGGPFTFGRAKSLITGDVSDPSGIGLFDESEKIPKPPEYKLKLGEGASGGITALGSLSIRNTASAAAGGAASAGQDFWHWLSNVFSSSLPAQQQESSQSAEANSQEKN